MKKIIYAILIVSAIGVILSSCKDEDNNSGITNNLETTVTNSTKYDVAANVHGEDTITTKIKSEDVLSFENVSSVELRGYYSDTQTKTYSNNTDIDTIISELNLARLSSCNLEPWTGTSYGITLYHSDNTFETIGVTSNKAISYCCFDKEGNAVSSGDYETEYDLKGYLETLLN